MGFVMEYLVTVACVAFFTAYQLQLAQWLLSCSNSSTSTNKHATAVFFSMLCTYVATRLLLQYQSPQCVIPVFLGVLSLLLGIIVFERHYVLEWLVRLTTIVLVTLWLLCFIFFNRSISPAQLLETHVLHAQMRWYHLFFLFLGLWRWFFTNLQSMWPFRTKNCALLVITTEIALLGIFCPRSGTMVAPSPWGSFDELLLERSIFLSLIKSLITLLIVMDQVAVFVRATEQKLIESSEKEVEPLCWYEFSNALSLFSSRVMMHDFIAAFSELLPYVRHEMHPNGSFLAV